jgi:hypothetical protein
MFVRTPPSDSTFGPNVCIRMSIRISRSDPRSIWSEPNFGRSSALLGTMGPEKPVFVADTGHRQRLLRFGALGLGAITGAWLIALLVGTLGFGRLPGLPLPSVGVLHDPKGGDAQETHRASEGGRPRSGGSTPSARRDPARGSGADGGDPRAPAHRGGGRKGGDATSQNPPGGPATVSTPSPTPSPAPSSTTVAPAGSTTPSRAPSQTPSGNPVQAGATGQGNAYGRALDPPGLSTRPSRGG